MSDEDVETYESENQTKKPAKTTKNARSRATTVSTKPVMKGKRKATAESDASEIEVVEPSKSTNPKPKTSRVNGKPSSKGKGRAPASGVSKTRSDDDASIEVNNISDDESIPPPITGILNTSAESNRRDKELQRLQQKLDRELTVNKKLSKELEDLFRERHTEPEQLLNSLREEYESQLEQKDEMIRQLQQGLSYSLFGGSTSTVLQLITRDQADEEQRSFRKENQHLKEQLKLNTDKRVHAENLAAQLQKELDAEVERSKSLLSTSKAPRSKTVGQAVLGSDDPKQAELVKFYEDLTNILVPTLKPQPSTYFDLQDWIFTCVYTYENDEHEIRQSLNFTLRMCFEPPTEHEGQLTKDDLIPSVRYVPLELDKEPENFVQGLGFLGSPFTFEHPQLTLFLKSMHDRMEEALGIDSIDAADGDPMDEDEEGAY